MVKYESAERSLKMEGRGVSGVCCYGGGMVGRVTVACAPVSGAGRLVRVMLPWCSSTIFRTMESPRPVPSAFVVKYGMKSFDFCSSVRPGPLSAMEM